MGSLSYEWNEHHCGGGPCNFSVRPSPDWILDFFFFTDLGLGLGFDN